MMIRPALVALALLPGCSAISALNSATETLQAFELRPVAQQVRAARRLPTHLTVELPTTSGALMNDRVLIRPNTVEAGYLPGAQWTDEVPGMVQTMIVRTLNGSKGYEYVGREPLGLNGDYALLIELLDLQAEIVPGDPETVMTRLTMTAQVVREQDARVISNARFAATSPAASDNAADVINALNTAANQIMPRLTRWTLEATGNRPVN